MREDEQAIRWAPDFRGRNWPGIHSHLKGRVGGRVVSFESWIFV
jgi:hypothetical protein